MLAADRFISYAQTFEDILLNRVFKDLADGFYIDIGAYHPVIGSITKAFYDRGWSGINVEPASIFEELERARPRDINIKAAVLDRETKVEFCEDRSDRGMSKLASGIDGEPEQGRYETYEVQTTTLNHLVTKYAAGREINFLKIDAEGAETTIITATDWKSIRPQVIIVEATAPWTNSLVNEDWEPILLKNKFIRAYFDGINVFYIRKENNDFLKHFEYPVNVLDNYVSYTDFEKDHANSTLRNENWLLQSQCSSMTTQISSLSAQMANQISSLSAQLAEQERAMKEPATRYKRLVSELRDPGGPRALTMLLPLARGIRRTRSLFGSPQHASHPEGACTDTVPVIAHAPHTTEAPRSLSKRVALGIYRIALRPIARPLLWRIRSFMLMPLLQQQTGNPSPINAGYVTQQTQLLRSLEALALTIASNPPSKSD